MPRLRLLAALALAAVLAGCPAFFVDRGELMRPSASLARPEPGALPAPSAYVDLAAAWRRETRIGIGGFGEATLIDPQLAAAMVAHEGAVQSLRAPAIASLLATTWDTLYGPARDRFPIDVAWRFDEQFISASRVLDPAEWTLTLRAGARAIAPLAVSRLEAGSAPKHGHWEGKIRVWFPLRDLESGRRLLGGETDAIMLHLAHRSGQGAFSWRFRSVF